MLNQKCENNVNVGDNIDARTVPVKILGRDHIMGYIDPTLVKGKGVAELYATFEISSKKVEWWSEEAEYPDGQRCIRVYQFVGDDIPHIETYVAEDLIEYPWDNDHLILILFNNNNERSYHYGDCD